MQRLYELGARRVMVTGTGPLGCAPAELAQHSRNGECFAELQQASDLFDPQLVQLLTQLNSEIGSDVFISANAFSRNMDFIGNPQAFGMYDHYWILLIKFDFLLFNYHILYVGFATSKVACCGQGPYNGIGLCTPLSNVCPNRDIYVFWDPYHPSERANRLIVEKFMIGSTKYMYPMNLSTIMLLDSRT